MNQSAMTVTSLNTKIKSLLETTFMHIMVEGEIASVTYHNSGHVYFSIKDQESSIKCVMFRSNASRLKFRLEQGQHIVVQGSVSVYTPRGEYQFYAVNIEPYGQGALALAYEQLKKKLQEKGYFDPSHKKPKPKIIRKIALVTASKSAALQDMLKIIEKRWRLLEVIVIDTLVQGERAAPQIAEALKYADSLGVDAIIVGRGGGSQEDLWAFNEEIIADAIYQLDTFVVSAVGHEVDVLISDFVADLRAPTPSAAMEMILPDQQEVLYTLSELEERYARVIQQIIANKSIQLKSLAQEMQRNSIINRMGMVEKAFERLTEEFKRTMHYNMTQFEAQIKPLSEQLKGSFDQSLRLKEHQLDALAQKIKLYDPKLKQKAGWAEVTRKGQHTTLNQIEVEDRFILVDIDTKLEVQCLKKDRL